MAEPTQTAAEPRLPRITIQFCTQCKWMLRAAYVSLLPPTPRYFPPTSHHVEYMLSLKAMPPSDTKHPSSHLTPSPSHPPLPPLLTSPALINYLPTTTPVRPRTPLHILALPRRGLPPARHRRRFCRRHHHHRFHHKHRRQRQDQ